MTTLPRAIPADHGVAPRALGDLFTELDGLGCHSAMLLRHGRVLAEGWWKPYAPALPHSLYSITKGFTAMAVGFALAEGLIRLDDTVAGFFPEYLPCAPCDHMRALTVRHLLTMSLGHISRMDHDFFSAPDWLAEHLRLYLELEPGTRFNYDNRCANLLSALVQKRSGLTLREYLLPRLFHKLGVNNPDWETVQGFNPGGWGLWLTTEELACFGQLLLQKGRWDGEQVIGADWIEAASARQIDSSEGRLNGVPLNRSQRAGYGYQFWRCPVPGAYRATGACGQHCIVLPEQEAVFVVTAGSNGSGDILEAVWKHLMPGFDNKADGSAQADLDALLAGLSVPLPTGEACPEEAGRHSGSLYRVAENPLGISRMAFDFGPTDTISLWRGDVCFTVRAGHNAWMPNENAVPLDGLPDTMTTLLYPDAVCAAAWTGRTYTLKMVFTKACFTDSLRLDFDACGVTGDYLCEPYLPLRGRGCTLMARKS